ncbi:protein-disulfide reductase DsbD domain-containing protein [Roseateles sp. GG27B]
MKRQALQTRLFGWVILFALWAGVLTALPARADDFLEPEQAFKLSVLTLNDQRVELNFKIAAGYYLYREQLKLEAQGGALGAWEIPEGQKKFDETFQKTVEIYSDALRVRIPISQAGSAFKLVVTSQGCAEKVSAIRR